MKKTTKNRFWFIVWTSLTILAWSYSKAWDFSLEQLFWGIIFTIGINGALVMYLVIRNENKE